MDALPRIANDAGPAPRSYDVRTFATERYVRRGVNVKSRTTPKLNVRDGPRSELSVIVTGMSDGEGPSRPAIAVARSCCTVPTTSPKLASLLDAIRLGNTTWTSARVIGNWVGPRLYSGCPNA